MSNVKTSSMKAALCAITALLLAACSGPVVRYDYDKSVNLANYHAARMDNLVSDVHEGGKAFQNPFNEQRLKDAVSREFAARGIAIADDAHAEDCYVVISIGTRRAVEPENRSSVRFGFGFGTWRPGFGSSVYVMDDPWTYYREGRVTIDLFDSKTKKVLWHASAEEDLTYLTQDNAEQRINKVVTAMFAKFPLAASVSNSTKSESVSGK